MGRAGAIQSYARFVSEPFDKLRMWRLGTIPKVQEEALTGRTGIFLGPRSGRDLSQRLIQNDWFQNKSLEKAPFTFHCRT